MSMSPPANVSSSRPNMVRCIRPIKAIAERAQDLEDLSRQPHAQGSPHAQLPPNVRAAFMAERVEPTNLKSVNEFCKNRKVMRLQRCGVAIKIVNHAGSVRLFL